MFARASGWVRCSVGQRWRSACAMVGEIADGSGTAAAVALLGVRAHRDRSVGAAGAGPQPRKMPSSSTASAESASVHVGDAHVVGGLRASDGTKLNDRAGTRLTSIARIGRSGWVTVKWFTTK